MKAKHYKVKFDNCQWIRRFSSLSAAFCYAKNTRWGEPGATITDIRSGRTWAVPVESMEQ